MAVQLSDGKVFLVDGVVATNPDCCNCLTNCGGASCALSGECPHSICFQVRLDTPEGFGDFMRFSTADDSNYIGVTAYLAGGTTFTWEVYDFATFNFADVTPAIDPHDGEYHTVIVQMHRIDNETITVTLTVDGISNSYDVEPGDIPFSKIQLGGINAGEGAPLHRLMGCLSVLGNPDNDAEEDFSFPASSFDSFTGGASVVDDILVIDDDDAGEAYATKTLDVPFNLICCCDPGEDLEPGPFQTVTVTATATTSTCCYNVSETIDATWNKHDFPVDDELQFFVTCDGSRIVGVGGFSGVEHIIPDDFNPCTNADDPASGLMKLQIAIGRTSGETCGDSEYQVAVSVGLNVSCPSPDDPECTDCILTPGTTGPDSPCDGFIMCDHQDVDSLYHLPGSYSFSYESTGGTSDITIDAQVIISP